ncbi:NACHT domain-containing protein [Paenibacillus provencensis]|uniref:NACHT domain-containing protein n=1 Tax=Paenibacillus provencensis TaxID=441151 RepID=A0ABW3PSI0_9BACL|nr:hypothetical protein [Paenibacillus sp. MER 78]MCM3128870.1 hypothetical protein [Paenibacillus sp. MER 78]
MIESIINSINKVRKINDGEVLLNLIKEGGFVFLFDGYDEIPLQIKDKVTTQLIEFISAASNNIYFLSSRPDVALSSFGDFQTMVIKQLKPQESYSLLRKYDYKSKVKIAQPLIEKLRKSLKSKEFIDLGQFLGNPLLISFIYITYKYKRDIPINKGDFYRKVYDALFEDHDYSKGGWKRGKESGLTKEGLHKFLRSFGFLCLRENKNDFSKDKLIKLIDEAKEISYSKEFDTSLIFEDIINTVPLIVKDGLTYKWAHKSFIDYFSACFIYHHSTQRENILNNIFKSSQFDLYKNMLDIYYDIDVESFDKVFVLPILNDYLDFL